MKRGGPVQDIPDGPSKFPVATVASGSGDTPTAVYEPTAVNGATPRQSSVPTTVTARPAVSTTSGPHRQQAYHIGRVNPAISATEEQLDHDSEVYHHTLRSSWYTGLIGMSNWHAREHERRVNAGLNAVNEAARKGLRDGLRVQEKDFDAAGNVTQRRMPGNSQQQGNAEGKGDRS